VSLLAIGSPYDLGCQYVEFRRPRSRETPQFQATYSILVSLAAAPSSRSWSATTDSGTTAVLLRPPPQLRAAGRSIAVRDRRMGQIEKMFTGVGPAADRFVLRAEQTSNSHIFWREPCGTCVSPTALKTACP